jgi:STE24 endopeptidase
MTLRLLLMVAVTCSALAASATPLIADQRAIEAPRMVENALTTMPQDDPRHEAYSHGGYWLALVHTVWALLVLWLIVRSGFGARLQGWVERFTRRPWSVAALYVALLVLLRFAAAFPINVYSGYVREKRFGFLNEGFGGWMGDDLKFLSVTLGIQVALLPLLYLMIRRLGRRWWLPGALITIACVIVGQVIAPVYIAPLFNSFTPLKDDTLRREILDMAHAQGIPADEVFEVDASRQSEHNNAYVAGILGTQRVVLYDTMLKRFTPREIRYVMGHEMGHYVLHHIWKSTGLAAVMIVIGFFALDRLARRLIARHPGWGIGSLEQPASLPLVLFLVLVFLVVSWPAISTYSRAQEHASDRFGLEVTHDPEAAASVFNKFGRYDLSEYQVNPVIEFLLFDHPSTGNRIRFAQEWARAHPEDVSPASR